MDYDTDGATCNGARIDYVAECHVVGCTCCSCYGLPSCENCT